jgi:hypothetical protein
MAQQYGHLALNESPTSLIISANRINQGSVSPVALTRTLTMVSAGRNPRLTTRRFATSGMETAGLKQADASSCLRRRV